MGDSWVLVINANDRLFAVAVVCRRTMMDNGTTTPVSRSGLLELRDTSDDHLLKRIELDYTPWCAAYSPDGKLLAFGTDEGHVVLYETEFYTLAFDWPAHAGAGRVFIYSLAWTPDGTRLITASGDSTVRVWDSRSIDRSRTDERAWASLRARMAGHENLAALYPGLTGDERSAARIELLRKHTPAGNERAAPTP